MEQLKASFESQIGTALCEAEDTGESVGGTGS